MFLFCLFFFFKQNTAYELRISDWSSDVCSSDLHHVIGGQHAEEVHERQHYRAPFAAMHPAAAVAHPLPVMPAVAGCAHVSRSPSRRPTALSAYALGPPPNLDGGPPPSTPPQPPTNTSSSFPVPPAASNGDA